MVESIRRVTVKLSINNSLHCLTLTEGPIEMIEEKTEVPNGRLGASLINKRELFGANTPPGYRCSNLFELLENRRTATGWQLRNIEASMARQARDLARLSQDAPLKVKRNIAKLSLARLRETLNYDPATGALTWRIRTSPMCKLGQLAGTISKTHGYRKIRLDDVYYTASHLAWFHFYGIPPVGLLDHKNGNRADDRIENLREATHSQNSMNMGRNGSNTTGFKGVAVFNQPGKPTRYRALTRANGKRHFLGTFDTPEEAHEAYCKAVKLLHGAFARTH
jgi:hypothetical protein